MRSISFTDKSFDKTQTLLYHLSIQISLDGFSFCILDIPKGKYVLLRDYPIFLKRSRLLAHRIAEIIDQEELLSREFKSTDILYTTRKFTLVPQALYSGHSAHKYFSLTHPPQKENVLEKNKLLKAEAWCLFEIPENLRQLIKERFPKSNLRHHSYPLIESSLKNNKYRLKSTQVHLNFFRHNFDIVVIDEGKLKLYNNFSFTDENDFLYFVLLTFDQLKLSQQTTEVIIHGHLPRVSPHYHLLKKYIRKVSFARLDTTYLYSYTFNQVPEYYYTLLLNQYKCE